ncbi:MAG: tol-pal system protein YbgF [Proteobacteria bacterium]|nr:tol-pal system protein YbgF [Pseudomonadota bacterium]
MKKYLIIIICLSAFAVTVSAKKKASIQDRLAILEQKINKPESTSINNADIIIQNQKLQQQIAELQGVIEEQTHQIQNLKDKQKLLYVDIDSRLAELEAKPATPTTQTELQSNDTNQVASVAVDTSSQPPATTAETEPKLSTYQDAYDIAFAHLRAGRFQESARAFEDFIQSYPANELTDDAYYWLGESYYVKRQYPQALSAFKSLANTYPNSKKAADSWLKIGYCYYEMNDLVQAEEVLNTVINNYPNTSIARLARNRLLQLQRDN